MLETNLKRIKNAIRFYEANGNSSWIGLGKTSAWATTIGGVSYDDTSPPPEDSTVDALTEAVCALKATCYLVAPDPTGTLLYNDASGNIVKYKSFSDVASAIAGGCTDVLVQVSSLGTDLTVPSFRQIGLFTDLVPASGHDSDTLLLSANISSWGDLEVYDNRTPRTVDPDTLYIVAILLQY